MKGRWEAFAAKRPLVARILGNSGWVFADRVLGMAVGLFVGLWVARYLAPERFGRLQYCMAVSGIFGGLAALGLDGLAMRDFVSRPAEREKTLATVLWLRLGAGLFFGALGCAVMWLLKPEGSPERGIMLWLGLVLVFQSSESVDWFFQSQYRAKEVVQAKWIPIGATALLQVGLVLAGASLLAFGFAEAFEAAAMALAMLWILRKSGLSRAKAKPEGAKARALLGESWAYMLSNLAITIYLRIDQVMLGSMSSAQETGLYAAASKISELWYFVPTAIAISSFPAVVEAKDKPALYKSRFGELHDLMFMLAFPVALIVSLGAPLLIRLLYGEAFSGAVPMLRLHVWAGIFVSWGLLFGRWLTAEGRAKFYAFYTIFGALINIVLNLRMIPAWGGLGASMATVLAYGASIILVPLFLKESRFLSLMQLRSLGAPWRYLMRLSGRPA